MFRATTTFGTKNKIFGSFGEPEWKERLFVRYALIILTK